MQVSIDSFFRGDVCLSCPVLDQSFGLSCIIFLERWDRFKTNCWAQVWHSYIESVYSFGWLSEIGCSETGWSLSHTGTDLIALVRHRRCRNLFLWDAMLEAIWWVCSVSLQSTWCCSLAEDHALHNVWLLDLRQTLISEGHDWILAVWLNAILKRLKFATSWHLTWDSYRVKFRWVIPNIR